MSSEIALRAASIGKCYEIYERPHHRLFQMFARDGKKFYKDFWALRDVSFEIRRGECVGIIGRNGSGKSTLLQMIAGTLEPSTGSVKSYGKIAGLLELGSGFNPEFTGRENVYLNGAILGLSKSQIDQKWEKIVEFADIGDFIERPVKTYSSGMYMRLAFSIVAHVDADILIIDEALAVGDAFFMQKCMRFLRKFKETGTLLFVSHDIATVNNLCNRVLWLESGNMKAQGPTKEMCEAYLETLYEEKQGAHAAPTDPQKPSFGKGNAVITEVSLRDPEGSPVSWVAGGETVTLGIEAKISQGMFSPIIGFFVKDRLGQSLFGETTYLKNQHDPMEVEAGQILRASFKFNMPFLAVGDYSVCVAIAEGTVAEHVQHHWIHDALFFKAQPAGPQYGCLVGIPMLDISISVGEEVL